MACGSGSLLLNVRKRIKDSGGSVGKIYGQEKNITTYNLARMNMLLHGMKDTEFEIFHGDTLIFGCWVPWFLPQLLAQP